LIAIIALLAVLALAICVIGAWIAFMLSTGRAGFLPGFAAMAPTALATTAANPTAQPPTVAPTGGPVQAGQAATTVPVAPAANPGAFSLASSQAITATRTITQSVLGPVSVGPEGTQMAVGVGRQIQLRNGTSLEVQSTLNGHTGNIYTMLFAPKATPQLLASGAENENTVRLWDVTNGTQLRALEGHTGWIRSLAFTADGKTLASGSTDNTIKLWDVASGTLLRTLTGHTDFLGGIGFSPDGTRLASASRDGSVRMWDVASGTQRSGFSFTMPADPNANPAAPFWATGLSFSPDGNTLAVGSTDRNIYMLNAETGSELRKLQGHTGWVVLRGLSFSPDGTSVASSGLDGTIRVWNAETGAERTRIDNGLEVLNISWGSDSTRVVSSSDESGAIVVWNVEAAQPQVVQSALVGQGLLTALSYSSDGSVLASGGINGIIRLNRLVQNDQRLLTGGAPALNYLTFLQNAQMAALSDDGSVNLLSFNQQQSSQELQGLNGAGVTMAASPDRRLLAVGSAEGRIAVWEVSSGRLLQNMDTQKGRIYSLAFSGDGQKVVAMGSGENPDVSVWDVQSGAAGPRFSIGAEQATALAVQNNGPQIATANRGGTLRLWDVNNGSSIREIRPDRQDVWFSGVAYSPDGSVLATGATDGLVEFWNPGTGERVGAIQVSNGGVLSMAFRSDGAQLAVSTRDGNIHLLEPMR
jgi:WD40 repeat protein